MNTITTRILAGEVVLTKNADGTLAAAALTEKLMTTRILSGETVLRTTVTATKKTGETVDLTITGIIGTTTVDGQQITKVTVTEKPAPVYTYRAPRPVNGVCRCTGDADNHGRCYQCGGYQRHADAGRFI